MKVDLIRKFKSEASMWKYMDSVEYLPADSPVEAKEVELDVAAMPKRYCEHSLWRGYRERGAGRMVGFFHCKDNRWWLILLSPTFSRDLCNELTHADEATKNEERKST